MNTTHKISLVAAFPLLLSACQTTIVPLQAHRLAASQPATAPATQVAATAPAATEPATQKAAEDLNQTSRFVYRASYDRIWQQSLALFQSMGFRVDRQDYRLGILTSKPLASAQVLEPWKPDNLNFMMAAENTIHKQQRTLRLTIKEVEGKPEFYQISLQVLVERQTNPSETLAASAFQSGSAFGRSSISLRSDYLEPETPLQGVWYTVGHDPAMEKKLLDKLFKGI